MSSSTFPGIYKYFTERKKHGEDVDELATVKAAAWAWYQRGSGSELRPMREFDLTKIHRAPQPTRYKLEAMKTNEEELVTEGSRSMGPKLSPSQTDNSLLDTYEIQRISKQLDFYIESSRFVGRDKGDHRRIGSLLSSSESDTNGVRSKNKSKKGKGFWQRNTVMCGGSKDDVVEMRGFSGGRRRPEKGVAVVGMANCRTRATHA
ncbi:uncharacterized protein LOC132266383 [Cornus florida]|uniref:uncharacterized protein LOC132266383 n=1 Tax=Cornus florida TaxID=4283 RepID=UPI0028973E20|nr:uncharacterized protein LOC132266383 [Cornus florida]